MKLFNAKSQQDEEVELTVDANNEIVATFKDGGFVKFPAGLDKEAFELLVVSHKAANKGQEVITPEMEAAKAAEKQASVDLVKEYDVQKETTE